MRFIQFGIVFFVVTMIVRSLHADDQSLDMNVTLEKADGLTMSFVEFTNNSEVPVRPGLIIIEYLCGDDFIDRIENTYRATISPKGGKHKDGGTFVCAGRPPALTYRLVSNSSHEAEVHTSGNEIFYRLPCGNNVAIFIVLKWNEKGYYTYEAPNGQNGVVSKQITDDGELARIVCSPTLKPSPSVIIQMKEWFRKFVYKRKGKKDLGYYIDLSKSTTDGTKG